METEERHGLLRPLRLRRGRKELEGKSYSARRVSLLIGTVAALSAGAAYFGRHRSIPTATVVEELSLSDRNNEKFRWTAHNKYTESQGFVGKDYPWLTVGTLVEPHTTTTLRAVNLADSEGVKCSLKWELLGKTFEGHDIQVVFTSLGDHAVTLHQLCGGHSKPRASFSTKARCRYVRRELRQLMEEDRSLFFETARILWDVSGKKGRETYGETYMSASDLTRIHSSLAADRECDHIHDGNGFLTQHLVLSYLFERSLQTIEPSLSLAYWDYTIEGERIYDQYNGNFEFFFNSSEVFQPHWFGRVNDKANTVLEGLWAHTEVDTEAWEYTHNSYGMLRAPWNNLHSKYVTRKYGTCGINPASGDTFPTCSTHYSSVRDNGNFTSTSDAANSWVAVSQAAPHGPVHLFMGGMLDCTESYDRLVSDCGFKSALVDTWRASAYGWLKSAWRYDLIDFPSYCSMDTPSTDCTYSCPKLAEKIAAGNVSDYVDLLAPPGSDFTFDWMSSEERVCLATTLCSAHVVTGDHIEASSAYDISFWPIHPTVERLFMYKVLSGNFQDLAWSEKAIVSPIDLQLKCYGHRPHEKVLFAPSSASSDSSITRKFNEVPDVTNAEVLAAAQPDKPGLTYVYDNFEWEHCKERGFDFRALYTQDSSSGDSSSRGSASAGSSSIRTKGSDKSKSSYELQTALSEDNSAEEGKGWVMESSNEFSRWMITSHPSFSFDTSLHSGGSL